MEQKKSAAPDWDYTMQAEYYKYRPNYAPAAIDRLLKLAGARQASDYLVADIGAGTGNLTKMLLDRGMSCVAVEPNDAMRKIGIEVTQGRRVEWRVGTGEKTGLGDASADLFAMGSSFNTTERQATLAEARRVLKNGGWFACLWNHRDLTGDPTQTLAEDIIRRFVPDYSHGVRREDQTDLLKVAAGFTGLEYVEVTQKVDQELEHYLLAWRSVKNKYWDLTTSAGSALFDKICEDMRRRMPAVLNLTYTTRLWMVRKI